MSTIQEIERAIDSLSSKELEQLYAWLEKHHPQPIDTRVAQDLASGRLDSAILRAMDDEKNGRTKPL
jgi:hypothetical protein